MGILQHVEMERNRGIDPSNMEFAKGPLANRDRLVAIFPRTINLAIMES